MSYLICHMEKINASSARGIQSHIRREFESKSNPDIDYSKTDDNYYFVERSASLYSTAKKIVKEKAPDTKTIRKDAVLINSFVITSDNDFFKGLSAEEQENFFRDAATFIYRRYGNLAFAEVHVDEKTPHLHVGVVPVKDGRLCSKKLFDKKELRNLQTDIAEEVGRKYGLERGKEGSSAKHLSELRFKEQTLTENIVNLTVEANKLSSEVSRLSRRKKELERQLSAFMDMCSNLEEFIEKERQKSYYRDLPDIADKMFDTRIEENREIDRMCSEEYEYEYER